MQTIASASMPALVQLQGHLTRLNAVDVNAQIMAALAGSARAVELDLEQVQFMDSAVLGVIVVASAEAKRCDRNLFLSQVPPTVRLMLEITGLDQRLDVRSAAQAPVES